MNKDSLRNEMLTALNKINKLEYIQLSLAIKNFVISSDPFKQAQTIGLTMSRFPEVDTKPIIEAAWSMGKEIVVPKCIRQTNEMDFRRIKSYDQLENVYLNLFEPIITETESIEKDKIDLQIVPGLLYSADGYRIGFGGGYYDRYLNGFSGHTMSLAFECQVNHVVPIEEHDRAVESIITNKGIIECRKNEGYNR